MSPKLRIKISTFITEAARKIGPPIRDAYTGEIIARGLVISFGSRIWLIGVKENIVPVFQPQKRLTYWRQRLGFTTHPPLDYPHEPHT